MEIGQRFDLKDVPVAARQNLHSIKQLEDESIEAFLQRVMTVASDGFARADNETLQNVAVEAFLRGCRNKDAAMIVLNEGPTNIQTACQRVKLLVANKRAVYGPSRVSFQERAFTVEEESRISRIEKSLDSIQLMLKGTTQSPSRQMGQSPNRGYSNQPPRYNQDNRGRSPTRSQYSGRQNFANRTGYSPSPGRGYNYSNIRPPSPQPTNKGAYPYYSGPPYGPPNQYQGYSGQGYTSSRGRPWNGYGQGYYPQGYYQPQYPPDGIGHQIRSPSLRKDTFPINRSNFPTGPSHQDYLKGKGQSPDRNPGPKPPDFNHPPAHSATPDKSLNYQGQGASATTP